MAIVDTWDASLPPDSENPTQGASRIREFKRAVDERLENMGAFWPDATDAASGRLTCGVQGTTGVIDLVYEADGDVAFSLHDDTAAANASAVVVGDGVGGSRPYEAQVDAVSAGALTLARALNIVSRDITGGSPYTVQADDFILYGETSAAFTVNLPAASDGTRMLIVIFPVANGVTFTPDGSDTVNGTTPSPRAGVTSGLYILVSDGVSDWHYIEIQSA